MARFLNVIQERTGLLIARAEGAYAFSHLTFQEYLAALAIAGRDDYVEYTLPRAADAWWREAILLEAGYLGTQSKEKTTRLIRAIADAKAEPEPYHNLVLAAECVRDADANRLMGDLETELRARLQRELGTPVSTGRFAAVKTPLSRGMSPEAATRRRIAAAEALGKIGGSQFWTRPHGEPQWVGIPPGEFTWARRTRRIACIWASTPSRGYRSPTHRARFFRFLSRSRAPRGNAVRPLQRPGRRRDAGASGLAPTLEPVSQRDHQSHRIGLRRETLTRPDSHAIGWKSGVTPPKLAP